MYFLVWWKYVLFTLWIFPDILYGRACPECERVLVKNDWPSRVHAHTQVTPEHILRKMMHCGIKICRAVLDTKVLNILCICCLYVINKLPSLLTTNNLSHTVNFARTIQINSSNIIYNIFVDNNIRNLSSISPIVNEVSDHNVFVSAHCHPICLEWEGNIKFKILPPTDICYTLHTYKSNSKLIYLCLI